ncbi:MAG: hypothetical protein RMA76_25015 [Deltaproteobacteria bacterium]|jgi:hypothetical protein
MMINTLVASVLFVLPAVPRPIVLAEMQENLRPRAELACAPGETLTGLRYRSFSNVGYADFADFVAARCTSSSGTREVFNAFDAMHNTTPDNTLDCPGGDMTGVAFTRVRQLGRWAVDAITPLCGPSRTALANPDLDVSSETYTAIACPAGTAAVGVLQVDREDITSTFTDPMSLVTMLCDCAAGAPYSPNDAQLAANPKPVVDVLCDYEAGERVVGLVTDGHTRSDGSASDLTDGAGVLCATLWDPATVRTVLPAEVDSDPSDDDTASCPTGLPPTGVGYLEQGTRGRVDAATVACGPGRELNVTNDVLDADPRRDPTNGPTFFENDCGPHDVMVGVRYADSFTSTSTRPDAMDAITPICLSVLCTP